jgi:hypothetical protein
VAPLTVVCLKWGTKYSDAYVHRLQRGVKRWLSLPHQFVCLTDDFIPGVDCRLMKWHGLRDWWPKVLMFKPGVLPGEKLYFDLDAIVTGPLEPFVRREAPTKVWALDDFSYSLREPKHDIDPYTRGLLGGYGTCNSSVMYWNADFGSDVWDKFSEGVMGRLAGDQNHITQVLYPHTLELYPPGLACSYKYHAAGLDYGQATSKQFGSVVVFHGDPKPSNLPPDHPLRVQWQSQ